MQQMKLPKHVWYYLLVWIFKTDNLYSYSSRYVKGRTASEIITGETPDISEYLDFGFYNWFTYRTNAGLG